MFLFQLALWLTILGASMTVACAIIYLALLFWAPKAEIAFQRLARAITYGFMALAVAAMVYTIDAMNRAHACAGVL